jgi:anthranilate phosphoribosyltransferase
VTPLADLGGWRTVLETLTTGRDLDPDLATAAVAEILSGSASDSQIGAFLGALQTKGPSPLELTSMVDAMLANSEPLDLPDAAATVDIVGTGGSPMRRDAAFNISTTACFVAAGAGVAVCKHGNRKASSSSGSTDALEALGVSVELDGPAVARCVTQAGLGFAFARLFHPAMRHAGPVRAELGVPTVFNVLGPLSHPGGVTRQLVGVANPALAPLVIDVLKRRGAPRAMVVHGSDGLDEFTVAGPSTVHELRDGEVEVYDVDPDALGLGRADYGQVGVGSPEANAAAIREVLAGAPGRRRDVVILNAAAGLIVGGTADDLETGLAAASAAIDDGRAMATLDRLIEISSAV